ncbi:MULTISPECIES: hypothetical protein [Xanthobacter]|uniref:Uncharacterized protein n=1 Tax=Xanthobacter flavus TaxID=281 RepID=A0A9W6CTE7_XANFL|nr:MULTISPECIES: hypothetical protein [Xanthobacter]MDR6336008.1 hypothetical protein [Xanthobacter flavus]NMN60505.1 hypothetical protein [Xanthobacter sp. SG618]UDQ89626.1 hypothetical protein LJE71_00930 [Xanthobacter autotrophicus]GLI24967.1 hypothetical protein XFLAVUS301_46410 [Xanthobacter flavus]
MKRIAFVVCALSILAGPALACPGMTNASIGDTTTTASNPVTQKGG